MFICCLRVARGFPSRAMNNQEHTSCLGYTVDPPTADLPQCTMEVTTCLEVHGNKTILRPHGYQRAIMMLHQFGKSMDSPEPCLPTNQPTRGVCHGEGMAILTLLHLPRAHALRLLDERGKNTYPPSRVQRKIKSSNNMVRTPSVRWTSHSVLTRWYKTPPGQVQIDSQSWWATEVLYLRLPVPCILLYNFDKHHCKTHHNGPSFPHPKMKMGFLESARRGGSEKSSFAIHLVKKIDHFQCPKKISAPSAQFIVTD